MFNFSRSEIVFHDGSFLWITLHAVSTENKFKIWNLFPEKIHFFGCNFKFASLNFSKTVFKFSRCLAGESLTQMTSSR